MHQLDDFLVVGIAMLGDPAGQAAGAAVAGITNHQHSPSLLRFSGILRLRRRHGLSDT